MKNNYTKYLNDDEIKALSILKEKILEKYQTAKLILYGSKARGDYNKDSDIDVLILLDINVNSIIEYDVYGRILSNVSEKYPNCVISLILKSKNDWKNYKRNVLLKKFILKEGVRI